MLINMLRDLERSRSEGSVIHRSKVKLASYTDQILEGFRLRYLRAPISMVGSEGSRQGRIDCHMPEKPNKMESISPSISDR